MRKIFTAHVKINGQNNRLSGHRLQKKFSVKVMVSSAII